MDSLAKEFDQLLREGVHAHGADFGNYTWEDESFDAWEARVAAFEERLERVEQDNSRNVELQEMLDFSRKQNYELRDELRVLGEKLRLAEAGKAPSFAEATAGEVES